MNLDQLIRICCSRDGRLHPCPVRIGESDDSDVFHVEGCEKNSIGDNRQPQQGERRNDSQTIHPTVFVDKRGHSQIVDRGEPSAWHSSVSPVRDFTTNVAPLSTTRLPAPGMRSPSHTTLTCLGSSGFSHSKLWYKQKLSLLEISEQRVTCTFLMARQKRPAFVPCHGAGGCGQGPTAARPH